MEVKCQIQNADGTDLRYIAGDATATDAAYLVNNVLHSLFADCTVSANGIKISPAKGHYAHKSFIETEFSHGTDAKKTWLKCQGYEYELNPGGMTAASRDARQVAARESEQITLNGKLAVDFFSCEKHLVKVLPWDLHSEDRKTIFLPLVRQRQIITKLKLMKQTY